MPSRYIPSIHGLDIAGQCSKHVEGIRGEEWRRMMKTKTNGKDDLDNSLIYCAHFLFLFLIIENVIYSYAFLFFSQLV
jgi:hypothetical protein